MVESKPGLDVPEADALEQARPWAEADEPGEPEVVLPIDAPEADVLDQARPVGEEDDDRRG